MTVAPLRPPAWIISPWITVLSSVGWLSGCAGEFGGTARGVLTNVEIVERGFVSMDGVRMPLEGFLLEMRHRARAAGEDLHALPRIQLRVAPAFEGDPEVLTRVVNELHQAGIVYISID